MATACPARGLRAGPALVKAVAISALSRAGSPSAARADGLDGLRGLAALAVLVFHAWLYTLPVPLSALARTPGDLMLRELRLGLVLFFALSGFLLYRPWVAAALDGTPKPALGRYLRQRAARIVPGYYLAIVGSVALLWGLAGHPGVRLPPLEQLPLFFIFGQNLSSATVMKLDPPMWTLAIEASFYLVLPLIGWLALRLPPRRAAQVAIPLGLAVLGTAYATWAHSRGLSMPWTKSLPPALPYFAAGMTAAVAIHGREIATATRRWLFGSGLFAVALFGLAPAMAALAGWAHVPGRGLHDLPVAAGFAMVIAAVATRPSGGLLASRAAVALGSVSFGLYLWNVPLLVWARAHDMLPMTALGATLAVLPATLLVAAFSWHAVELPVVRAVRRSAPAKR